MRAIRTMAIDAKMIEAKMIAVAKMIVGHGLQAVPRGTA
jgi:hypothetical protein